jgi:hypothetical protein
MPETAGIRALPLHFAVSGGIFARLPAAVPVFFAPFLNESE